MDNKAADDYIKDIAQAQGEAIGLAKGKAMGEKQATITIVKNMCKNNIDNRTIHIYTGLSIEEIEHIRQQQSDKDQE